MSDMDVDLDAIVNEVFHDLGSPPPLQDRPVQPQPPAQDDKEMPDEPVHAPSTGKLKPVTRKAAPAPASRRRGPTTRRSIYDFDEDKEDEAAAPPPRRRNQAVAATAAPAAPAPRSSGRGGARPGAGRPTGSAAVWYVPTQQGRYYTAPTQAEFDALPIDEKRRYSHVGRIEEVAALSAVVTPGCRRCRNNNGVCRKYTGAAARRFDDGRSQHKCARCRWTRKPCFP